jgi:hypothetical protein
MERIMINYNLVIAKLQSEPLSPALLKQAILAIEGLRYDNAKLREGWLTAVASELKAKIPQSARLPTDSQIHEIYCKDVTAGERHRHSANYYAGFKAGFRHSVKRESPNGPKEGEIPEALKVANELDKRVKEPFYCALDQDAARLLESHHGELKQLREYNDKLIEEGANNLGLAEERNNLQAKLAGLEIVGVCAVDKINGVTVGWWPSAAKIQHSDKIYTMSQD